MSSQTNIKKELYCLTISNQESNRWRVKEGFIWPTRETYLCVIETLIVFVIEQIRYVYVYVSYVSLFGNLLRR